MEVWGKVYPTIKEEDGLRPRSGQGRAASADGQAARERAGDGSEGQDHLRGDEREVLEKLSGGSTSYVERTNLTSRHMNGRLVRKTLGYSKELKMLRASSIWEDAVYNLCRALKTLRIERPAEAPSSDAGRGDLQRWRRD